MGEKVIRNMKVALEATKRIVFSKEGIIFYLILLFLQIPFIVPEIVYLISFFYYWLRTIGIGDMHKEMMLFQILSFSPPILLFVVVLFFPLNVLLIGAIISYIASFDSGKKIGIFQSLKNTSKKLKKLLLASILVLLLNLFVYAPSFIFYSVSLNKMQETNDYFGLNRLQETSNHSLYFLYFFLYLLSRFGKPILPISNEAVDLCIINGLSCAPNLLLSVLNLPSIFALFISLIFIFLFQEIILTEQSFKESVKRSFAYFKNNPVEIAFVWLVSSFIFVTCSFVFSLAGYLVPILPAYIGHAFAFLLVIIFQTSYYLNFVKRYSLD